MKKDGSVLKFLVGVGVIAGMFSVPGCSDGTVRSAPEAVVKAKKEDVDKAQFEAIKKAGAESKAKAKTH